jgi:4'-phosphopantetheinyl transferase EntD
MSQQPDLGVVITQLFPDGVASCFSASVSPAAQLLPEELPATTGMAEKRLDEFRHGRHCARVAMTKLGMPPAPVPKGADRAPLWPAGLVGSISHTGPVAAAVIGQAASFVSLGLDMETDEPLAANIMDMICLPGENPSGDGLRGKLLFSIKEAVYKCLYPLVGHYIDFREMEIITAAASSTFRAYSRTVNCPQQMAGRLNGRFAVQAGYVISAAWVRQA